MSCSEVQDRSNRPESLWDPEQLLLMDISGEWDRQHNRRIVRNKCMKYRHRWKVARGPSAPWIISDRLVDPRSERDNWPRTRKYKTIIGPHLVRIGLCYPIEHRKRHIQNP